MRRVVATLWLVLWSGGAVYAQTGIEAGAGAPSIGIRFAFLDAWQRNGFNRTVSDPTANVASYGQTGLIQRFPLLSNSTSIAALIRANAIESSLPVYQVLAPMFTYYGAVGVTLAGYPNVDTLNCPALKVPEEAANSCLWQTFSNNYALFAYAAKLQGGGQTFATRSPFYAKWGTAGGIDVVGPATSAEAVVTSQYGSTATLQTFDQGAIYNITAGSFSGRILAVKGPIYAAYLLNAAHAGALGMPTSEELILSNGHRRQTFESGAIDLDPATGIAVLRPPVSRVNLFPQGTVRMNAGETLTAQVTLFGADGATLTDRTVAWSSSNGQIAQVQGNGSSAVIKAVGAGTAVITAIAEGKASATLTVSVVATCCQIGEGAPTQTVRQAFQNAVTRNRLNVQIPSASAVTRTGRGYTQLLLSTSTPPVPYLIAVADGAITGYVVSGAMLAQYDALEGPTGVLGYPLSDATPGGRQAFQQGTLAGDPVQLVRGAILTKWSALGFETGPAGSPVSATTGFLTFRGTTGSVQSFERALILNSSTGPAFAVTGLILAKYSADGGPSGELGAPLGDEHLLNGLMRQDFEGGRIEYAPGSASATVVVNPRQPLVTATPASVLSGGFVHLVAAGFASGATVRVSQSGQPDFLVTAGKGAYIWDVRVPPGAASGTVTIRAAAVTGTAAAQATYTIRSAASSPVAISIVSGDQQTGAPGARLALPLVVSVKDQNGISLPGQTVTFAASPGASISPLSAVTDEDGLASAELRMAAAAGIGLATAQAGGKLVTFSARSAASRLTNFPALSQALDDPLGSGPETIRQKGALLTAAASILRYYQLRGELPQPNGLADVLGLNQFLKTACYPDSQGGTTCDGFFANQTVNLWRVGSFAANTVTVQVESADLNSVRDRVTEGLPVLLVLALNGGGSHFVVATGVAADGNVLIVDTTFGRTSLAEYVPGLQAQLTGAVLLLPEAPPADEFVVAASGPVALASQAGACGAPLEFSGLYFRACDGSGGLYQLDIGATGSYSGLLTAIAEQGGREALSGSAAGSSHVVRSGTQWTLAPVATSIRASGVVNAASFTAALAPGGLVSIFGTGLNGTTSVQVNGQSAPILASFPFQVNAQVPLNAGVGQATLTVISPISSASQAIVISGTTPAIFSIGPEQGAITNQNNSLNTALNPAVRGSVIVIYGTGFGAVTTSGNLSRATVPVSAVIGGVEIPAVFAGLTPGFPGLYQANVVLPLTLPPGLNLPLYLKQAGTISNSVAVAVQ